MNLSSADLLFTPCPPRIRRLRELAYNLWWTWRPEAQDLYRQIDSELWEAVYHNPVQFLRDVRQRNLDAAAANESYLAQYDAVLAAFDSYMNQTDTWWTRTYPQEQGHLIAYFCAEFGIHESLPIYSGGLGILAGDHVKTASDLGLPFVGVGFIYPQGYFRQEIDPSGWQHAVYHKLNFADVAATQALTPAGEEVIVSVELPGRMIYAKVYTFQVGRVRLLLMDTDIHPNDPQDRDLSARLYGGDQETRIKQEIVLGIGGVRALRQMGLNPTVYHMNEGHSAFLVLELARELVQRGMSFRDAARHVTESAIFTTHTPVPAGNDAFPIQLMQKYFASYWPQLGLDMESFIAEGLQQQNWGPTFAMTVLALRLSNRHNGVSQLHGAVARQMWQWLYPDQPLDKVPITAITNGIHTDTWLAPRLRPLYAEALGPGWEQDLDNPTRWANVRTIPDATLWGARQELKRKLVAFARLRTQQRLTRLGIPPVVWPILDENALTIGFARRFATYKRATLIFRDPERLRALLNNPERPVQIIFAGKAHPADDPGKRFIQDVYQLSQQVGFAGRIVFLEEYDMYMARELVQGVDVWLNTPRRPMEASGTSGQKAALNGAVNVSILDGWWPEAYNGKNGWAIGEERQYNSYDEQDWHDSQHLYHLLETEIVPLFYQRGADGIPHEWMAYVKESIATIAPVYNTWRMVKEYTAKMYVPSMDDVAADPV